METTNDYVKVQRKLVELAQGVINESKDLGYELSSRHIAVTKVRDYITGLVKEIGLEEYDIQIEVRDSWIGEVVELSFENELRCSLLKSEVARALVYAKLISLGQGLMEVPEHMYTDRRVLNYLNDLSVLMELSPKTVFTPEELNASIEAYKWWGESMPLIEHIRRAATAYLPGNGFQRESMLTRAFLAYYMSVKMEEDEGKQTPPADK